MRIRSLINKQKLENGTIEFMINGDPYDRREKVKIIQKLLRVIIIFIFIFNLVTLPIPHKERFDKSTAEELLKEAYIPLEDFVKSGIPMEDEELLLAANDIRNEKDFIRLFNNKIDNEVVEQFFKDLVIEKQGVLYIDKKVYIPTIYAEDSILTNSYIKKYKGSLYSYISGDNDIQEEKLIIKEKWKVSGEWHRRSNFFIKNEDGEWILDYFTGTSMYRFVDSKDNPWS